MVVVKGEAAEVLDALADHRVISSQLSKLPNQESLALKRWDGNAKL